MKIKCEHDNDLLLTTKVLLFVMRVLSHYVLYKSDDINGTVLFPVCNNLPNKSYFLILFFINGPIET